MTARPDKGSRVGPAYTLASASPRRRRLAAWLGSPFRAVAFDTPEELAGELAGDPPALAARLAADKARAARDGGVEGPIAAFDTIVDLDGRLLGKPEDLDEARAMLAELSGREHLVHTGVAFLCPEDAAPRAFAVTTPVRMRELAEDDVEAWVAKGELLGCAGAYNIESHLASVEADECFQNVAGLPLCHLYAVLASGEAPCAPEGLVPPNLRCDTERGVRCLLGEALTTASRPAGTSR
ncbi:MAG: Maf family protein [Coriobacteriia bacterium]|nr:Maf family protein [Coriobacteriia bacterium]